MTGLAAVATGLDMTGLLLDRTLNRLRDGRGRLFDPSGDWIADPGTAGGEPVTPREALRWLQRESGAPCRVPVAVIGTREPTPRQGALAREVGRGLGECGVTVLCGGRGGVMEAVCQGVAEAGGLSIGLLPDDEPGTANPYVTVPIATGIGVARNAIIARGCCCAIAIGGGYGTLSEIAFALQFRRPVLVLDDAPVVKGTLACADAEDAVARVAGIILRL